MTDIKLGIFIIDSFVLIVVSKHMYSFYTYLKSAAK